MRGEDVRAEDIIADKIVRMAQGIKEKGKLGFPSTIYKLYKEARQEDEEEDHPMPQAGEGNEEGNEEQGYDHDYHHQPDFEQQQPEFEHHQEFNEPPVQQPLLYHVPTYTDQHQKDLASIEEQLQNMMWFYNQVRQEQREMVQEIQQIKNYQLRDWTRNASARESYSIWAHQQANPNLVEMSSQKIVKQIYDNIDHKRPMFRGLLKSELQPSNPALPPSSSKDPKDPPSSSKDSKDPRN
ncbi:hypothetical protein PIB30_069980 [Stylosanthes scabra]|uniref:Uncharacterized protein n=1 Tax=Stylosanthes scabra TaxID=79078 RepID=A0ABU6XNN2_9FABA|nr:hypothetical protein [Stylosanthes scabra]